MTNTYSTVSCSVQIANSSLRDENGTPVCNGRPPHSEAAINDQRNDITVVSVDVPPIVKVDAPPGDNPTKGNENQARTNTNIHSSNYGCLKNTREPRHGSRLNTNSVNSDHGVAPVETSHILADIEAAMTAQKAKYSHKDIRGELQDISVDMSRITLGSVLHEGLCFVFSRISGFTDFWDEYKVLSQLCAVCNSHCFGRPWEFQISCGPGKTTGNKHCT